MIDDEVLLSPAGLINCVQLEIAAYKRGGVDCPVQKDVADGIQRSEQNKPIFRLQRTGS